LDTKSKNISYSSGVRLLAIIIVWLGFLGTIGSCLFLLQNQEVARLSSYTETYSYQNNFSQAVKNTVDYHVVLKSEDHIKISAEDSQTESHNIQRFHRIENQFPAMVNYVYYVQNTETGEKWTNLNSETSETTDPIQFIQRQRVNAFFNAWTSDATVPIFEDVAGMMTDSPYEVYAAVVEPLEPGDIFYDAFMDYTEANIHLQIATNAAIVSFILMAVAFIYLIYVTGRREPEEIMAKRPVRLYTDVHTILVCIAAFVSLLMVGGLFFNMSADLPILIAISVILSLDVFIGIFYVLAMVEQIRTRQIFTNSLIFQLISGIRTYLRLAFQGQVFKIWILLLLLGYGFINGLLFMLCAETYYGFVNGTFLFMFFILLAFNAGAVYFAGRSLIALSLIMEAVKEISAGNTDYPLNSTDIPVSFYAFAQDILNLQGGLKKAVAVAVKGERMKTDLITNVSHDLKTPLTSIINYVDLLKQENLENEKATGYVNILEEKSSRLKQLIEDLVEASKASSGNLAIIGEKVNLQELIMQAGGEYEEKIQQAQLDLHIHAGDETISVRADGRHMWRIAENLLSNAIKYSMPHTRVYIDTNSEEGYGSFTIKNISAFPLNISPEQLTERFVRGDESRSTEGSGLGLSIAQSLTALQGGKFQLEIDGDLFKVTVALPLWAEEQE